MYIIDNYQNYDIHELENPSNSAVIFRGIVGSRAYGTQNANSDTDVRGIFVVPSAEYARLETLLSIRRGEWKFDDIMGLAEEKKASIEAGKGNLPPDCDKGKVDELIVSVMKEAGVS